MSASTVGAGEEAGGGVASRGRVSAAQLDALLAFMEEHRGVAAGRGGGGGALLSRFATCRVWRLLAERLNALAAGGSGVRRSPDRWCRYWTDIKYKVRKKWMSGGALGELSSVEERLRNILEGTQGCGAMRYGDTEADGEAGGVGGAGIGPGAGGAGGGAEELVAEAAMRSALAAERQADSVAQGVELLRELVGLVRSLVPPPPPHLRPL